MSTSPVVLWGVSASPYVRKAQVALAEKNIAYNHIQILPKILLQATNQSIPKDFDQASLLGRIPALQVGDFHIADSAVIAAYLDKKFSTGNKLYPETPEAYARALWFENYADTIFSDAAYKKIFLEVVVKPAILKTTPDMTMVEHVKKHELLTCLKFLENEVSKNKWLAGDEFSMADVAITTHFISLAQAGYELDKTQFPKLHAYKEKVLNRDSFKKLA